MRGISWLAANRLASQERLCSMEWVSKLISAPCGGVRLTPRPMNKKETFIFIAQAMNLLSGSTHCWSALLFLYLRLHLLLMKYTYFVHIMKLCLRVSNVVCISQMSIQVNAVQVLWKQPFHDSLKHKTHVTLLQNGLSISKYTLKPTLFIYSNSLMLFRGMMAKYSENWHDIYQ
jgi:hypothetical protein